MYLKPAFLVVLVSTLLGAACAPLGPIPGGRLSGATQGGPPPDWAAAGLAHTIQLESRPTEPYSVNTWCASVDGRLYVPSSLIQGPDDPSERSWVRNVLEDPRVRLRIAGVIYEFRAVRVENEAERERVRTALLEKYEITPDDHAAQAWIFRMDPR